MRFSRRPPGRSRLGGVGSLVIALALAGGAGLLLKPGGRSMQGRASAVDGDTLRLNDNRIRLKGIDAPELAQSCTGGDGRSYSCGQTARRALVDLMAGQTVRCRAAGRDRYQRILARCTVSGADIGTRLVEQGWAVSYGRDYEREEARARSGQAGLWAGAFERPQEWRRSNAGRD